MRKRLRRWLLLVLAPEPAHVQCGGCLRHSAYCWCDPSVRPRNVCWISTPAHTPHPRRDQR